MLATNLSDETEASDNADRQAAMASPAGSHTAGAMPAAAVAPGCRSPGLPQQQRPFCSPRSRTMIAREAVAMLHVQTPHLRRWLLLPAQTRQQRLHAFPAPVHPMARDQAARIEIHDFHQIDLIALRRFPRIFPHHLAMGRIKTIAAIPATEAVLGLCERCREERPDHLASLQPAILPLCGDHIRQRRFQHRGLRNQRIQIALDDAAMPLLEDAASIALLFVRLRFDFAHARHSVCSALQSREGLNNTPQISETTHLCSG